MDDPKKYDENAKAKDWQTPMNMPTAGKGAYNSTMSQSGGTQAKQATKPAAQPSKAKEKHQHQP